MLLEERGRRGIDDERFRRNIKLRGRLLPRLWQEWQYMMMMMVGFEQMQDTVRGKRERGGNDWLGNEGTARSHDPSRS